MTTTFHDVAQAIAYALGEPPDRVDWAEALVYGDGEIRYLDTLDETDARDRAQVSNLEAITSDRAPGETDVVRAFPVYQEMRVLADGMQIISPWLNAEGE